jgi:hypothetical protein
VDHGHVYDMYKLCLLRWFEAAKRLLNVSRIIRVRETRLTGLLSHILIGLSLLMIPVPLHFITTPVLYGLFVYIAVTALHGNQLFERILLFITEQVCIPQLLCLPV